MCSSAIITCAKLRHPLLCHYSHEHSGSYWVRQARLVLCCLDGERVVDNDDNSVLASSDYQLEVHYEMAVSALSLEAGLSSHADPFYSCI